MRHRLAWPIAFCFLMLLGATWTPSSCGQATAAPDVQRWRRGQTDCDLSASQWAERLVSDPSSSQGQLEAFEFRVGHGTELQLVCAIEPARVIPEWSANVSVKTTRSGARLFARVVLPHAFDRDSGRRLTVLIPGTAVQEAGEWSSVSIGGSSTKLMEQLQQSIWVLRQQYGKVVSDQDAYVDQLILDVYSGPGSYQVQIGSHRFTGTVGAGELANSAFSGLPTNPLVRQVSLQEPDSRPRSRILRDGTVLELDDAPFMARVIQHNGETFEFLRSLGFNVVQLPVTATDVQLLEAEQAGLWVICPPPPDLRANTMVMRHERVLGWVLGDGLGEKEFQNVNIRARELREVDRKAGRPILVGAQGNWANFSQAADVLMVGQLTSGSTFPLRQFSEWVSSCRETTGNSLPVWCDLHTEFPGSAMRQIGGLVGQLPPLPFEPQQMQFGLVEALAGGARGIRFLSRSRLDASDPQTRLRTLVIQWLNRKLDQYEPWVSAGVVSGSVATGNERLQVTALKHQRATLLFVQQVTGWEQLVAGDSPLQTIRFTDTYSAVSDRAYWLADYGLVPLSSSYAPTGTEIQIDACPNLAAIVLTQDPEIVNALSAQYDRPGSDTLVNLHDQLTHQWFAIMQLIEGQVSRSGGGTPSASNAINEALRLVRQAETLIAGASPITATNYLDAADQQLGLVRRELLSQAGGEFRGLVSAPLLMHASLLPLHWEMARQASQTDWAANGLAGGEFENLDQMLASGWENFRAEDEALETLVELSPSAAVAGQSGLKLTARSEQAGLNSLSIVPLRIVSGPVQIPAGKMIRIHGWVNLQEPLQSATEGLLVFDSLGGRDLAARVQKTDGWQEVVLYRAAPEAVELRLTIQMTGTGEVLLDEFTIQTLDLPQLTPRTARHPDFPANPRD